MTKKFSPTSISIVETEKIGVDTTVSAFTKISSRVKIGEHCKIGSHVYIDNDVAIGNYVTIEGGVQIGGNTVIEEKAYIGANVVIANSIFSDRNSGKNSITKIRKGVIIKANATITSGITIGNNAVIEEGAIVKQDVPANTIISCISASISGYVSKFPVRNLSKIVINTGDEPGKIVSKVKGVEFYKLPLIIDMRGNLSFAEYGQYLPFLPKRYFIVFDVSNKNLRGEHAHKTLQEYLVCVKGSCTLIVDDGANREEIIMDAPNVAVYVPPMVWRIHYRYSTNAVLMVLASDIYDANDYIRDYDEFLRIAKKNENSISRY